MSEKKLDERNQSAKQRISNKEMEQVVGGDGITKEALK